MISKELLVEHNLTDTEYRKIVGILGREPTLTELGVFSVMWSEHCSYKSSRPHLKRLPTHGAAVVQGPGENAGIVDIGDGQVIAFKIESHNHPSFIEPFQGAATGVGGILRDIFAMGARPIASMNSLRFGPLDHARNRRLLEGVVGGIASYGNCFGVPTVGGEVYFSECYSGNPLVNALALGVCRKDQILYGRAHGVGNPVIYVGARTGRDGIHGATMASAGFGEDAASKRPNVQIGDPFLEKLLLEACLEAMQKGLMVGIQDMGAAGLACSSSEMAARAKTGIDLDLDRVPQREAGMSAYEIVLSESQERMLLVAERSRQEEVSGVFHKWGLDAVCVGHVTGDGLFRIRQRGQVVGEIPALALAEEGPVYNRPLRKPSKPTNGGARRNSYSFLDGCTAAVADAFWAAAEKPGLDAYNRLLEIALTSPNLASRQWISEQYDHMVQSNTMVGPGSDAAVIRIKGTRKALAVTLDGPAFWVARNPREGARLAVAEACRNVVCSGARPLAATNCLNFGNPEHPEVMWQFSEVIDGMAEALNVFGTPITGGNVSFYNETFERDIDPTPVIGMVGLIEDISLVTTAHFKDPDDSVVLVTRVAENSPWLDLEDERALQGFVSTAIREQLVKSAHDLSEGGLAAAVAESCFSTVHRPTIGATISVPSRTDILEDVFGEFPSRILLSTDDTARLHERAGQFGLAFYEIGTVGGERIVMDYVGTTVVDVPALHLEAAWRLALPRLLENKTSLK